MKMVSKKRLFGDAFSSVPSTQSVATSATQYAANFPAKFEALLEDLAGHQDDLFEPMKRKKLQSMVFIAKQLVSQEKISKYTLGKMVRKYSLPLEFVWMLHCAEIIHFTLYIEALLEQSLVSLGARLANLLKEESQISAGVSMDLMKSCINMVHGPEPPSNLAPVKKSCRQLIHHTTKMCLFPLEDPDAPASWWLVHLLENLHGPVFAGFSSSLLRMQLTSGSLISVQQALARQQEWSEGLPSFKILLESCDSSTSALNLLIKIVNDGCEVNWKAVLISVSSYLRLFPDGIEKLSDLISAWLSQSLEQEDTETLLLCFVLARQMGHTCPSAPYATWFKRTFASKQTTPCKTNQHFAFLLKFLDNLVQYEPHSCLKIHLESPPYVPLSLKTQLNDFRTMLLTRMKDLTSCVQPGIFPADQTVKTEQDQISLDVEKAISHFESSNKIHDLILKTAICRKKYFDFKFLPALLVPRDGIKPNDAQIRLVDSLLKAEKISAAQFDTFQRLSLQKMQF